MLLKLAQAVSATTDRLAIRQALIESPILGGSEEADDRVIASLPVMDRLGLAGEPLELTLGEAARHARRNGPVAAPLAGSGSWLVVVGRSWNRIRVATDDGSMLVSRRVLEAHLGLPGDARGPWLAAHAAPLDEQGDHDSPPHDDHHHGPSPPVRLWRLLRPESTDIVIVAVFAAVIGVLSLATPVAVESLVNTIAFGRLVQPIVVLSLVLLAFLGFAALLRMLQTWVAEILQRRIFVRVVADLAWRLPRVEQKALDRQHGPELMNRFFDVMTVQKSAALLVVDGIAIVLQTAVGMAVLAFYHPILLGFDVVLLILIAGVVYLLGRGSVRTAIDESKAKYEVAAWLEDIARHQLAFKGSGGDEHAVLMADRLAVRYLAARQSHFAILIRQIGFALALQAVAGSVLFGIGGWLVVSGQLTLGQLVAAELIVTVIVGSFAKLGKQMESFYDLLAAVDKLGHLFDLPVERQSGQSVPWRSGPAIAQLQDAEYRYPGGEGGLEKSSLELRAGEILALTGPAGSGKSTLLDLLYALRTATSGYVEIDGQDLRELRPCEVRRQVILIRDAETLTGTIADNLYLERLDVSHELVADTLAGLGLRQAIRQLPAGMQTRLLPSGAPLTENQGRLLALARALVGQPRLLLIDGLLDSLQDETLARVLAYLRTLRTKTTIVIVTGRTDVERRCDRVVSLGGHDSQIKTSRVKTLAS